MKRFWAAMLLCGCGAAAPQRTVAITVDDLPFVGPPSAAVAGNRTLLDAFRRHHVPVTGFVIRKHVEDLGADGPRILAAWRQAGLDLGNHSYSHPDMNNLPVEEIEQEIVRGEAGLGKPRFFRFPMNHTGDTKEKHDAVAAFLAARGYELAACTIENSDYLFSRAYVKMLARNDAASAERLRREYLEYTAFEIDWFASLGKRIFGYEPPEVMLLHDNPLNAALIDQVLALFETRGYRFVSLAAAQSGAAYRTPDTYITKFGPMWGYRWSQERGVQVDGRREKDPPEWIVQYAKDAPTAPAAGEFYLGKWKIVSATVAPWADAKVRKPDANEMRLLFGQTVAIEAAAIRGPRALACSNPRYAVKEYPADMLFQGAFGEMHARDHRVDPANLAAQVGFRGSRWKTLETGCEVEIDYHFIGPATAAFGLNDYVYTLKKQQ
ncbi:MAG TPA: polysaccharide deacetylase family protein [Bryobacteraceae bacterium]|nr:polysaccharide deacetylase family protein [Bryobacteraceae bacterium]